MVPLYEISVLETIEMGNIQKDIRNNKVKSSPGSMKVELVQDVVYDEKVTPKPGIRKNKLVAKYGTNFRYMGIVKNGLDRVMVVMSILIPRFQNIKVKPINFAKCAKTLDGNDKDDRYLITVDTQASKAVKEWCSRAIPYIEYLQQQEKYYIEKVHELLCDDLYSALSEVKPTSVPLRKDRNRRGIGTLILTAIPGLITLAVESVSSWIKDKQTETS